MEEKTCIICMDESTPSNIIEYNHCGKYYVHESCNDKWLSKNKTCFICRNNLIKDDNENLIENEDFITINMLTQTVNENNNCPLKCCIISTISTGITIILFFLIL